MQVRERLDHVRRSLVPTARQPHTPCLVLPRVLRRAHSRPLLLNDSPACQLALTLYLVCRLCPDRCFSCRILFALVFRRAKVIGPACCRRARCPTCATSCARELENSVQVSFKQRPELQSDRTQRTMSVEFYYETFCFLSTFCE